MAHVPAPGPLEAIFRVFRERCRGCASGRMTMQTFIRATMADENGRRYPAAFAFFSCDRCGLRRKKNVGQPDEAVSDGEWARWVERRSIDDR